MAILKSDKIDLKLKVTRRDKKGHFILIKGRINPNHITALNTCASNTGTPNFIKSIVTELKTQNNKNPQVTSNTPLSPTDMSS